jgi:hypothetical protein
MTTAWTFRAPKKGVGGLYCIAPFFDPDDDEADPPYKIGKTFDYTKRYRSFLTCYPNGFRTLLYLSLDNMSELLTFFKVGAAKVFDVPLVNSLVSAMETDAFKFLKKKSARIKCAPYTDSMSKKRACEFVDTDYDDCLQSFLRVLEKYNGYQLITHTKKKVEVHIRLVMFQPDVPDGVLKGAFKVQKGSKPKKGNISYKVGTTNLSKRGFVQWKKGGKPVLTSIRKIKKKRKAPAKTPAKGLKVTKVKKLPKTKKKGKDDDDMKKKLFSSRIAYVPGLFTARARSGLRQGFGQA